MQAAWTPRSPLRGRAASGSAPSRPARPESPAASAPEESGSPEAPAPDRKYLDAPVGKAGRSQRGGGLRNQTRIAQHLGLVEHDRIPAAQPRQPRHFGAQAARGDPGIVAQAEHGAQAETYIWGEVLRHVTQRCFFQFFE